MGSAPAVAPWYSALSSSSFTSLRPSLVDPALPLCPHLQLLGDLLGRPLGRSFDGARSAHLAPDLDGAADDEADRVSAGHGDGKRQRFARSLGPCGVELPRAKASEPAVRHDVDLDDSLQLGCAGAEAKGHALRDATGVDRDEIADDRDVIDLRRGLARGPHAGETQALDLFDQILRDFRAELPAEAHIVWRLLGAGRGDREVVPGREVGSAG